VQHWTRKTMCPTCRREVAVAMPRRGDGSTDCYPRHYPTGRRDPTKLDGGLCPESRQELRTKVYTG
jgi:hypothetical protein